MKNLPFYLASLPLLAGQSVLADSSVTTASTLPEIIVSASRTYQRPTAQATLVIEREQIERSTATNLPDLLRQVPGLQVRQLFGVGASEATVDLGAFGPNAGQNTLILIDGQRQNDIDLSAADIGSLSLDNIERIEVLPGSGGVLYGAGAVGGTINIVTRNLARNTTSVKLAGGSFSTSEARLLHHFAGQQGSKGQLFVNHLDSAGYRDNNQIRRIEAGAKLSQSLASGNTVYGSLLASRQDSGLPGARRVTPVSSELKDDPRGASSLTDYADTERAQALAGWRLSLSPASTLVLEGGHRQKQQKALVFSFVDSELGTTFLSPRLENRHQLGKVNGNLTAGLDLGYSDYNSDRKAAESAGTIHRLDVSSRSQSIYAYENLAWQRSQLTLGARQTRDRLKARDRYNAAADPGSVLDECLPDFSNFPCFSPDGQAAPYNETLKGELYEIAFSQKLGAATEAGIGFARSQRLATVDELFEGFGPDFRAFSPLKPQTGRNVTVHVSHVIGATTLRLDAFQNRLRNEIYFNAGSFSNENLDPTRRRGITASVSTRLGSRTQVDGSAGYQSAQFTAGSNDGNDVPLVARRVGQISIAHDLDAHWQLGLSSQYTGARRFDNDDSNDFGQRIPSMIRSDARISYRQKAWTVTATVLNLSDERDHVDYAVRSVFNPGVYNAYPLPDRHFVIGAEYRF